MFKSITAFFLVLVQSYLFVIVFALFAGLFVSKQAILLAPYATLFLQIIFFMSSLKLNLKDVFKEAGDIKTLLTASVFMLILFPVIVYYIAQVVVPTYAVGLLLLAAMPAGMTAPLLVEVVGGKVGMALVLTLLTSFLAPFTVPIVVEFLVSTAVTVSAMTMFVSLTKVILIPFALAQILRFFLHNQIKATYSTFKPISLILLGFLIAGVVAKQADVLIAGLGAILFTQILVVTIFIGMLLLAGYYVGFWKPCEDRLTIAICLTFMNFTLAIYLAGEFFRDPNVLLCAVLVIFPWSLLLLPYKWIMRKFVCPL